MSGILCSFQYLHKKVDGSALFVFGLKVNRQKLKFMAGVKVQMECKGQLPTVSWQRSLHQIDKDYYRKGTLAQ